MVHGILKRVKTDVVMDERSTNRIHSSEKSAPNFDINDVEVGHDIGPDEDRNLVYQTEAQKSARRDNGECDEERMNISDSSERKESSCHEYNNCSDTNLRLSGINGGAAMNGHNFKGTETKSQRRRRQRKEHRRKQQQCRQQQQQLKRGEKHEEEKHQHHHHQYQLQQQRQQQHPLLNGAHSEDLNTVKHKLAHSFNKGFKDSETDRTCQDCAEDSNRYSPPAVWDLSSKLKDTFHISEDHIHKQLDDTDKRLTLTSNGAFSQAMTDDSVDMGHDIGPDEDYLDYTPQPPCVTDPNYKSEKYRLGTFKDKWCKECPVSPEDLARDGFICLWNKDKVQCIFCRVIINNWVDGDDVRIEHKRLSPCCPQVKSYSLPSNELNEDTIDASNMQSHLGSCYPLRGDTFDICGETASCNNINIEEAGEGAFDVPLGMKCEEETGVGMKQPTKSDVYLNNECNTNQSISESKARKGPTPEMTMYNERLSRTTTIDAPNYEDMFIRLATFDNRWSTTLYHIRPLDLASDGFIFQGPEDEVKCVYCQVTLKQWREGDDVRTRHVHQSPECPWVCRCLEKRTK